MSSRLRDLVRLVRSCKTASEEREVISKEAAVIRTYFSKDEHPEWRPRNVAKLLYMNMMGYPTHWGQMECIKLIVASHFAEKRIGYLGLNILLDEKQEVLMLATQSLKTDILNSNQYIAGLALNSLGNIGSEQICRDCAPEIEQLLGDPSPYLRKKAVLGALKICTKVPELVETFIPKLKGLLNNTANDHGVIIATLALVQYIAEQSPEYLRTVTKQTLPSLLRILKTLAGSGFQPEYDVGNISDPFVQVKILMLLRLLKPKNPGVVEKIGDTLAKIASRTENARNVGNAILYECVQTILALNCDEEVRTMGINVLGRFLSNKDNNIRYVGLKTLGYIVAQDTSSVQRHRNTIVECLKDPDLSIRRRALQLIYSLVDKKNVKILVKELISFLTVANPEFRAGLTVQICYVAEKFAPNNRWLFNNITKILSISGEYVPEEVTSNLIATVSNDIELARYGVSKLMDHLNVRTPQSLLQVTVWCIGEFGDVLISTPRRGKHSNTASDDSTTSPYEPHEVLDVLDSLLHAVTTTNLSKNYLIQCLFKLMDRFPSSSHERLRSMLQPYKESLDIELQQRACEYDNFWECDEQQRKEVLKRIPIKKPTGRRLDALTDSTETSTSPTGVPPTTLLPPRTASPTTTSLIGDLLGGAASTPIPTPNTSATASLTPTVDSGSGSTQSTANSILDLLGGGIGVGLGGVGGPSVGPSVILPQTSFPSTPTITPTSLLTEMAPSVTSPTPTPAYASAYPPLTAYANSDLTIIFHFSKPQSASPQMTKILVTFTNVGSTPLSALVFQAAPPRHMKYTLEHPSNTVLAPGAQVTQVVNAVNEMHGQKAMMMKLRVSYANNGTPHTFDQVCKNFPPGL